MNSNSILNIETQLSFNRHTVTIVGKQLIEEIKKAKNLIDTTVPPTTVLATLCKKVGIYFAFYLRDKAQALRYLEKFQALVEPNTQEAADAYNLIGFANTLDRDYKETSLFAQALEIYSTLSAKDGREIQLEQAFARRYIALMFCRQGEIEKAKKIIQDAINIQKSYQTTYPSVNADLAESTYVFGMILKKEKNFTAAEEKLLEAIRLWDLFCRHTNSIHSLKFNAMQSLSNVYMKLNKHNEALELLEITHADQLAYFKNENNPDIIHTLNLIEAAKINLSNNKTPHQIGFFQPTATPRHDHSARSSKRIWTCP